MSTQFNKNQIGSIKLPSGTALPAPTDPGDVFFLEPSQQLMVWDGSVWVEIGNLDAAEVLAELLTVDGSGSGLDADLLDGLDSTEFAIKSQPNTFTDNQTISALVPTITLNDTTAATDDFFIRGQSNEFLIMTDRDDDGTPEGPEPLVLRNATSDATIYGSIVWTAANDGTGSGLDADTLDGIQSTNFLRSDQTDTMNGILVVGGTSVSGVEGGQLYLTKAPDGTIDGPLVMDTYINQVRWFEEAGAQRGAYIDITECSAVATSKIWHNDNDGTGSGLDADTVDGLEATAFVLAGDNTGEIGSYVIGLSTAQTFGTTQAGVDYDGTNTLPGTWKNVGLVETGTPNRYLYLRIA